VRIAGEEADLSWPRAGLIVEIDGGPFHRDVGEDARKEATWRSTGWAVVRISSDDVYDRPSRLLAFTPSAERAKDPGIGRTNARSVRGAGTPVRPLH
jgi:very-short-patch-repair endonuclease